MKNKTSKQLLFERMHTVGGMPLREEDWGYRAGDITGNPPETLANFGGGRGTGHFGTGFYFFGSEEQAKSYSKPLDKRVSNSDDNTINRPINKVDFSKYNLLRVKNNIDGYELHEALKSFQGLNIGNFKKNYNNIAFNVFFINENRFPKDGIIEEMNNVITPSVKDFVEKNKDLIINEINQNDEYDDEEINDSDLKFSINYGFDKQEYQKQYFNDYIIATESNQNTDNIKLYVSDLNHSITFLKYLKERTQNFIDEKIKSSDKTSIFYESIKPRIHRLANIVSKIDNKYSKDSVVEILNKKIIPLLRRDPYISQHGGKTTLGTELIKALGYNGVDVRGVGEADGMTGLDNSTFGSVIYDLNKTK